MSLPRWEVVMRFDCSNLRLLTAAVLAFTIYGCGGSTGSNRSALPDGGSAGAGPSPDSRPVRALFPVKYVALGASDAVGIGASVPCGIETSFLPGCPGGTSYVPDLSRRLFGVIEASVKLRNLGMSGALLGPSTRMTVNLYGSDPSDACTPRSSVDAVKADVVENELPNVPSSAIYTTVFAGGNDIIGLANALGCGAGGPDPDSQANFVAQQAQVFAADYDDLIAGILAKTPNTRIVLANIPNLAGLPFALSKSDDERQALQTLSVAFADVVNALAARGIPVVDLLCDPRSYDSANYFRDGFHPNDAGYRLLADSMQVAISSGATPQVNCAQRALSSARRRPLGHFNIIQP